MAFDREWLEVFKELVVKAAFFQCMPNEKTCYEAVLKDNRFVYHGVSNSKGAKRPTVNSFVESHKDGTYVLRTAHHIVAVKDGYFWDSWDSGSKCLYGYWEQY